ncbi:MAG: glycoside hydrolase [Porphyromonadaceae bacterium CG2_30_38_12]|nr:MAG: glycoside hydrolase [Porphyromonadaceae bacterium CG2_30_38_12]
MKKILFSVIFTINLIFAQAQVWKAQWISSMECQSATNTWLAYRKTVEIKTKPEKAIARIAVDSKYWMWINGQMIVFEGGLKRGPNPLDTYYDEVDIAPLLKSGKNTVAILVWYFGKDGFSHKSSGRAGMIFDCQSPDFELLSNNSWECSLLRAYQTADEPLSNFRLSESSILYDARKDIGTWQAENYIEKKLSGAMVLGEAGDYPWNKLVVRPIPLLKDFGLKNYLQQNVSGVSQTYDTIICELPYNMQVTPYLKIDAPEGKKITICTDNYLYFNGGAGGIRAEYISKNGVQEFESLGWLNGHKMYYIIPKGVKILDLKYRESGYDTEFAGSFHCSNPFFNKLWEKANRTLYLTMRDSYMDCPDRERAQWTGDAVNEAGESFYALSPSSHALTKKWLYELFGWQRTNGSLFAPVPAGNWNTELPCQSLVTIGYYGLWTYYQYTGDKQTIADLYDGAKRYLGLWQVDGQGTMKFRGGDWSWGDWGENCDMLLIENLWYYLAIKGMHNMANELGKTDDAVNYAEFMSNFKVSFNKQFWNGTAYRNPTYNGKTDDRTQALAVVSGIADPGKYPALLNIFQTEEHASPYMEKYVFEAMMQMGYEKEAMQRHQKRFSGMVNNTNFTTLFEGWGIGVEGFGGGTVNHAWSGGGLTILSQYVCGIAPIKPGFDLFQVIPQLGSLTEASATVETVKGTIRSSVQIHASGMEIKVTVPASTSSVIGVPASGIKRIKLNGKIVWKNGTYLKKIAAPSLHFPKDRIGFEVSSGEWQFVAK